MKKTGFFFLLIALLVMGKYSLAQEELPKTWISGGTTCTLTMDDHYFYALTVSVAEGQDGIMADYSETAPAPWNAYVNDIHTLVIEEGVNCQLPLACMSFASSTARTSGHRKS